MGEVIIFITGVFIIGALVVDAVNTRKRHTEKTRGTVNRYGSIRRRDLTRYPSA